jgi:Leucine-rich repeat (LRR) protein
MTPEALRPLQQSFSITDLHLTSSRQDARAQSKDLECITRPHLAVVSRIPNLKSLLIESSALIDTDLDPLADAERLEELFIREIRFLTGSLNSLGRIPRLKRLVLELRMSGYVEPFEGFPELQTLAVSRTRISPEFIRALGSLRQLETLSFEGCFVNESLSGLAGTTKLKRLNLLGSDANDEGVRQIGPLSSLEVLELAGFHDGQEFLDLFPNLRQSSRFNWWVTQQPSWNMVPYVKQNIAVGGGFF